MGPVNAGVLSSMLLLPESIAIEAVYPTKTHLTVQIACVLEERDLSPLPAILRTDSQQLWANSG